MALLLLSAADARTQQPLRPFTIAGDGIAASLTGAAGSSARGRQIVTNRQVGMCLLCHSGPFPEERLPGTLAPDLTGPGQLWSGAPWPLRIAEPRRLHPTY